ncbi:MAG TPA: hypothetical protein VG937_05135 [Polyangiaceae bacterium]|nr:hypothetical protein [Polyangiaceae bacterium]
MTRARRALSLLPIGLLLGACSVPDYRFVESDSGPEPLPPACSNLKRDVSEGDIDCGGPCPACGVGQRCNTASDCKTLTCNPEGQCAEPTCSDLLRNGGETDSDCGGPSCDPCLPGRHCLEARDCASGECRAGVCSVVCAAGTAECDDDPSTECETNPKTDPLHCGECGHRCTLAHALSACSAGSCTVSECVGPFADCDGLAENGCETNLSNDPEQCGQCGKVCVALGGAPLCADGACSIRCDDGYGDCDENAANGCEALLGKDVKNCGKCGVSCEAGNGTPWCYHGVCGISDCPPGFGDCNANPADGCEVDLRSDSKNCKDCGARCLAANGSASCQGSVCVITACKAGFDDCNSGTPAGYADGCETDVDNDRDNCGSCNHACTLPHATAKCEAGKCELASCTPPYADCDGDGVDCEVNTETNSDNCGGCGANGLSCSAVWNARHGSGHCANSTCVFDGCLGSYRDCNDNSALDGCETDVQSNAQHCGSCTLACAAPHGTNSCVAGACTPSCGTAYGDCDRNQASGCETVFATDSENCGACGVACAQLNAQNVCQAGACVPTCTNGFLSCDQNPSNGCETDARTNKQHCGSCDGVCQDNHTSSNVCQGGACVPICQTGYSDCDSSRENGCETASASCGGGTSGGCAVPNSVLCDDFEDGSADGWTATGTWAIVTDGSRAYQTPLGSAQATAQTSWGDQSVEARVKALAFGGSGSSYRVGILARYSGSSNYYALAVDGAFDLRILRGTSAPSGTTGTCNPIPSGLKLGAWFSLKLVVSGASSGVRLRSYVNGTLFHDCTTTSSTVGGGTVGLSSYGSNTRAEFDDLVVTTP